MLRPLVAVTAAAVLLAGCSGGDDKKSDSPSGEDTKSTSAPTPTTPELPSFDPPKGFSIYTAVTEERPADGSMDSSAAKAGMVGQTTLYANKDGLTGVVINGSQSWKVPSKDVESTKITGYARPLSVQFDGKEVIAMVYSQNVEAGGTQKAHGQVLFQWIDPADGKVLSSITFDTTTVAGPGTTVGGVSDPAYDPATGQLAVGVGIGGNGTTLAAGSVSVFADPKTKKAVGTKDAGPVGLLDGSYVGVKGNFSKNPKDLAIVLVDGATGAIKKTLPVPGMDRLYGIGGGKKYAYISGNGYVQDTKYTHHNNTSIYAVDLASGAIVETKMPKTEEGLGFQCVSDHVTSVVCTYRNKQIVNNESKETEEIIGFDDATGKKAWGYTSAAASRVVPTLTTAYNGYVYGKAETLPAVLDARTGEDVPAPAGATTTSPSSTPTSSDTPTDDFGPTSDGTPTPGSATWGDLSLIYGEPQPPEAVSKYGSTYLLGAGGKSPGSENILVVQKAIG